MLNVLIKNAKVYYENEIVQADMLVCDGTVASVGVGITVSENTPVVDGQGLFVFPGFADVHVHLREKASVSALLTMPKPLTVWITINCGKF